MLYRALALASISACLLLVGGCESGDPEAEAGSEAETGGEQAEGVTLVVEADASGVCGSSGGAVELVARRVDCFDPPLPCTLANPPVWLTGTSRDCDSLAGGAQSFELTISQTGRWETRLQAAELACFGLGGVARTDVSKADLAANAELVLAPAPAGQCGEP